MCGTHGSLKAGGQFRDVLEDGVGGVLENGVELLSVLGVEDGVELLGERLGELLRVLLQLLQRAGGGGGRGAQHL